MMGSEASGELTVRDYHNRDPHGVPLETKAGDGLPLRGEDRSAVRTTRKIAYRAIKGTKNSFDVAGAVTGSKTTDEGCSSVELPTYLQGSEPPCPNLVIYELGVLPSGASPGAHASDFGITAKSTIFTTDRGGNIPPRLNQYTPKVLTDGIESAIIIPGTDTIGVNESVFPGVEPVLAGTGSLTLPGVQDSDAVSSHNGSTVAVGTVLAGPIVGIIADTAHVGYASIPVPDGHAKGASSGIGSGVFPPHNPLFGPANDISGKHHEAPKAARETCASHHAGANFPYVRTLSWAPKKGTNAEPLDHGKIAQIEHSGMDAIGARSLKGVPGDSIAAAQATSAINAASAWPFQKSKLHSAPTSSVLNGTDPTNSYPATGAQSKSSLGLGNSVTSPGKQDEHMRKGDFQGSGLTGNGYVHCNPGSPAAINLEMTNDPPIKSWKSLVSIPVKKGGPLQFYISHCTDGKIIAKPPIEAVNEGIDMWKGCLVGQFLDKRLLFPVVCSLVNRL